MDGKAGVDDGDFHSSSTHEENSEINKVQARHRRSSNAELVQGILSSGKLIKKLKEAG